MINWKSLILFILTIALLLGSVTGGVWFSYNYALEKASHKFPEITITPESVAVYTPNQNVLKKYVEHREGGYSIMMPRGYKVIRHKDDPAIYLRDKNNNFEISIDEKLIRYEKSLASNGLIKNPKGDYYVLLKNVFEATVNPILLFQKINYLPSSTTHIKNIKTPNFFGFYIVSGEGDRRVEIYRLFDEYYWHNIRVSIFNPDFPHWRIQNILATLKNTDEIIDPENAYLTE